MNAIDGMLNHVSGFLEKVANWIPKMNIPWHRLTENWSVIERYIAKANVIFPLSDLLIIMGLVITFLGIMLIIWTIKFLKEMIPFFG